MNAANQNAANVKNLVDKASLLMQYAKQTTQTSVVEFVIKNIFILCKVSSAFEARIHFHTPT